MSLKSLTSTWYTDSESRLLHPEPRFRVAEILSPAPCGAIGFQTLLIVSSCGLADSLPPNEIQRRERPLDSRCRGWETVTNGSRYNAKNSPNLYLNDDKPTLNNNWEDNANPNWGAASCGSVWNPG